MDLLYPGFGFDLKRELKPTVLIKKKKTKTYRKGLYPYSFIRLCNQFFVRFANTQLTAG